MRVTTVPTRFTAEDRFSNKVKAMSRASSKFATSFADEFNKAGSRAFAFSRQMAVVGVATAAPLIYSAKKAVEFEDKMSDVAKTSGLQGKELRQFGDDILNMSLKTRSSIEDLATIAEIGGRLGIAKSQLKGFTVEANKFAVALGGDFAGGVEDAITQFGKLSKLFSDTKNLNISDALRKSGSSFNALSAKGVNVEGLTDFSLRVAALPEVMRPTLAATAALGATLQKSGVNSEIAASGFSNFVSLAARQLPAFSKQMGISLSEAQELMRTDTASFFAKFAASMKGIPADQLAIKLKNFKLNSLEVQKAIGGVSGNLETYKEMLRLSGEEMKNGTSINKEYNTKNNNTAGQLAKLKNSMQALAITAGNALLPIVNQLVQDISPLLRSAGIWMQKNRGLVTTLIKVGGAIAGISLAVSGFSLAVGIAQKGMVIYNAVMGISYALMGKSALAIRANTVAMSAYQMTAKATALINPWGLAIAGAALLAVAIYKIVQAYNDVGTAQRVTNEVNLRAYELISDQKEEAKLLFNQLRFVKEGSEKYKSILEKINSIQGGVVDKYIDAKGHIKDLTALEKTYMYTMSERAKKQAEMELYKESKKELLRAKMEGPSMLNQAANFVFGSDAHTDFINEEARKQRYLETRINTREITEQMKSADPKSAEFKAQQKQVIEVQFKGLPEWLAPNTDVKVKSNNSNAWTKALVVPKTR